MSELKATPGEWLVKDQLIYALNDERIQVNRFSAFVDPGFGNDGTRINHEEVYANVHLMRASKELYSNLQSMCEMWRTVCEANGWDPEHMAQYQHSLETLKKARGEQS